MAGRISEAILKFLQTYVPLKAFLILRLISGQYCDLNISSRASLFAKLFCVFVVFFVSYGILINFRDVDNILDVIFFVLSCLVSLVTQERSFLVFCDAVAAADRAAGWHVRNETRLLYVTLLTTFALSFLYIDWIVYPLSYVCSFLTALNRNTETLIVFITYSMLHQRMALIRRSLKSILYGLNDADIEESRSMQINRNVSTYKMLLDGLELVNINLQVKFALATVRCMCIVMGMFLTLQDPNLNDYIGTYLAELACSIMTTCAPSVVVEMALNEADEILNLLTMQLAVDKDPSVRAAASRGARYVRRRPLRARLLRVLPLHSAAPLALLSFYCTYTFIQLQLYFI